MDNSVARSNVWYKRLLHWREPFLCLCDDLSVRKTIPWILFLPFYLRFSLFRIFCRKWEPGGDNTGIYVIKTGIIKLNGFLTFCLLPEWLSACICLLMLQSCFIYSQINTFFLMYINKTMLLSIKNRRTFCIFKLVCIFASVKR